MKASRGIFAILCLLAGVVNSGKKSESSGYKTTYACEGKYLDLVCTEGIIHLIRANYGRFSISICNDHGNLDWRVNCMSHHSYIIMQERCDLRPNCSVSVSSKTFLDPCPGTLKYLEVQYHCGIDAPNATTSAPTPPPGLRVTIATTNITSLPNIGKIQTASYRPILSTIWPTTPPIRTSTTRRPTYIPTTAMYNTTHVLQMFTSTIKALIPLTQSITSSTAPPTLRNWSSTMSTTPVSEESHCSPIVARGIHWGWTAAEEIAFYNCPEGASGIAEWKCDSFPPHWSLKGPSLRDCRSLWMSILKARMHNGESIINLTNELIASSKVLYSEDVRSLIDILQQALLTSIKSMENFLDPWHRYNVLRELLQSVVQTVNKMLEDKQFLSWEDLQTVERKAILPALLERLEELGLILADISSDDGSFSIIQPNIWFSLQVVEATGFKSLDFPALLDISSEKHASWEKMEDSISIPTQAIEKHIKNGKYKVVFLTFKKLDILLPFNASISEDKFFKLENVTRMINSRIISAAVDKPRKIELSHPIIVTLKHLQERNMSNSLCVFWDREIQEWSSEGCWVKTTNRTHTVCLCNHLSNFAVVMDVGEELIQEIGFDMLQIITSTSCIISVVALLFTVIILLLLRSDISQDSLFIHRNLFTCLLLSEILLVGGMKQTAHPVICGVIAGFLQYLFLVTSVWMFYECLYHYLNIMKPSDTKKSKIHYYYVIAYSGPLIITCAAAFIDSSNYGMSTFCWLQSNIFFAITFIGPVISMVLAGFVFASMSFFLVYYKSCITYITRNDELSMRKYKTWNKRTNILIVTQTSTWTSGLLYVTKDSIPAACIFGTLNSIQGILILYYYCFQNEKVKEDFKKLARFELCFKKRKEAESQPTNDSISNAIGENDHREFWTLHEEADTASTSNIASNSTATLTIQRPSVSATDENTRSTSAFWMVRGNTYLKTAFSAENVVQDSVSLNLQRYPLPNANDHCQEFIMTQNSNGQFQDHIYETIDSDAIADEDSKISYSSSQRFRLPENYCANQSDLSQKTSSSYGYDHQPLIVGGFQNGHFSIPRENYIIQQIGDPVPNGSHSLRRNRSTTDRSQGTRPSCNDHECNLSEGHIYPQASAEFWESGLPDILQNPPDNNVVMAVLDGDKVVNRIPQDDGLIKPHYKLSTYC